MDDREQTGNSDQAEKNQAAEPDAVVPSLVDGE